MKRSGDGHSRVATLGELKIVFVLYLKEEKLEILECKVEAFLEVRGHKVLWTPLYCPQLQPRDISWTAGEIMLLYTII